MIFKDFWLLKNLPTGKTSSHILKNSLSRDFKTLDFNINLYKSWSELL